MMKVTRDAIEFEGPGRLIQFVHANAYTPRCYRKFLEPINANHYILAPIQRPLWEGQRASQLKSWTLFRNDLIRFMDARGLRGVIGIGHSLGGIATWMAAVERPDLFERIVLIDPVLIDSAWVRGGSWVPFFIKKRYLPIVKIALKRRDRWPDRHEVSKHLGRKKLFQRWDPEVFEDFLKYGITDDHDEVRLAFPKAWEARIYATPPNMWPLMPLTPCPVTIIKAEFSDVITPSTWQRIMATTAQGRFYEMPGVGHLIPFEKPLELAQWIMRELLVTQPVSRNLKKEK